MQGLVFDIQGFSVHDGSGCRTLVFLSGCPLRCAWCANPEGQLLRPRLLYRQVSCVCSHQPCIDSCPYDAITLNKGAEAPLRLDRTLCDRCEALACVEACFHGALEIAGRLYTVEALMQVLKRDQGFWGSQGGVTFAGGEPMVQSEFLLAVLAGCRSSFIHTTLETSACTQTSVLTEVLKWTDAAFIDIKHMDPVLHRQGTGAGNELILRNIERVAASGWQGRLIIRVPIIPGYNDTFDNLRATAEFISRLGLAEVNLLPFHRLGQTKYEQLGLCYDYAQMGPPSTGALKSFQRIFTQAGLQCYIGSDVPI